VTTALNGAPTPWGDALLAASMIAVDPHGLAGVHVRSRSGAARDRWLEIATAMLGTGAPVRRIAAGIPEFRLTGGLDINLTIERGRPVVEQGALAGVDGGLLVLSMAERLELSAAAVIGMALDEGAVRIERDGVSARQPARFALFALDEGIDDEALPAPLADRMGIRIDLNAVSLRDLQADWKPPHVEAAREILPSVTIVDDLVDALCVASVTAGSGSMRPLLHLVRAARAAAALRGSATVGAQDAVTALRLVLGMNLLMPDNAPVPEDGREQDEPPPEEQLEGEQESMSAEALRDMMVEAAAAVLPDRLLASLEPARPKAQRRGVAGKAGALRNRALRGRAVGTTDRPAVPGARIDVISTLRQAAPWQGIRAKTRDGSQGSEQRRLHIRRSDFRYLRLRQKTGTTAIFAVDASGSAAVERLAETKGAIELLLAECYVRRDQVALIAFRGQGCETLLEPTRSLVRAKRSLAALPGGGGTPLASGILATHAMAIRSAGRGQSVVAVFLTDGRGNVALDGETAKAQVADDTGKAARTFRAAGIRAIVIDTGRRPQPRAEALAQDLGAEYLALPRGGSTAVAREIGSRMEG
jgi:magnesium chelatase subunit D